MKKNTILICDGKINTNAQAYLKIYSFSLFKSDNARCISLPVILDDKSDEIRSIVIEERKNFIKYAEKKFANKSILQALLFWMSLPIESSILKCSEIKDLLLLKTFELHFQATSENIAQNIQYEGSNRKIAKNIEEIARRYSINFIWKKRVSFENQLIFIILKNIKSIFILILWRFKQIRFKDKEKFKISKDFGQIFFLSYLLNYKTKNNRIVLEPDYWENLPNFVQQWTNKNVNNVVMETLGGKKLSDNLFLSNGNMIRKIESVMNLYIFIKSLYLWIRMYSYWLCFRRSIEKNIPNNLLNYWITTKGLWRQSLIGACALDNIFFIQLFDEYLKKIPKQKYGFYLQENQGWERGFIHCWKKNGHGKIIGVAHSTVRYWDLRNYDKTISVFFIANIPLPRPDFIAINGLAAIDQLKKISQFSEIYYPVEALRYSHLDEILNKNESAIKRVLILSDYRLDNTIELVKKINKILDKREYNLSIKLHPMINKTKFANINKIQINIEDCLKSALSNSDLVIGSSFTSALLDAYCQGWPIINILDGDIIDSSPFKGLNYDISNKIYFINDLLKKINNISNNKIQKQNLENIFFIDKKLVKWKNLISDLEIE